MAMCHDDGDGHRILTRTVLAITNSSISLRDNADELHDRKLDPASIKNAEQVQGRGCSDSGVTEIVRFARLENAANDAARMLPRISGLNS